MQNFNWQEFVEKVEKLILYVSSSTESPINADRWEEIIFHTLKGMGRKYQDGEPKWISGSHAPGADLWIDEFGISAKAGKVTTGHLVISSYRLTRFENLEDMISYIDGPGKNFDIYLCCARTDTKLERIYNIFLVSNDVFKASELEWSELFNSNMISVGWKGSNKEGIAIYIRRKMSNQLWIELPLSYCKLLLQVKIPKAELGKALQAVLNKPGN